MKRGTRFLMSVVASVLIFNTFSVLVPPALMGAGSEVVYAAGDDPAALDKAFRDNIPNTVVTETISCLEPETNTAIGSGNYPMGEKYKGLLKHQADFKLANPTGIYDSRSFDISVPGKFTKEQARKCLEILYKASMKAANVSYLLAATPAKFLLAPPSTVLEGAEPKNPFYMNEVQSEGAAPKTVLATRQIGSKQYYDAVGIPNNPWGYWWNETISMVKDTINVVTSSPLKIIMSYIFTDSTMTGNYERLEGFQKESRKINGVEMFRLSEGALPSLQRSFKLSSQSMVLLAASADGGGALSGRSAMGVGVGAWTGPSSAGQFEDIVEYQSVFILNDRIATDTPGYLRAISQNWGVLFSAEMKQKLYSLSTQLPKGEGGRCGGTNPAEVFNGKVLRYTICVLVDWATEIALKLVDGSTLFLSVTSGIQSGSNLDAGPLNWLIGGEDSIKNNIDVELQLNPNSDRDKAQVGVLVRNVHDSIMGLLNILLIIAFIVIALANILQVQISTYSLKKALPAIVIGFLMANMSFFAVRAAVEVSSFTADALVSRETKGTLRLSVFSETFRTFGYGPDGPGSRMLTDGTIDTGKVVQQAILNIFLFIAAVLLFILAFLFLIRSLIIFFLVPMAPLAFFSLSFQPLASVWQRWYKLMLNWLFMPTVAIFWIWLGMTWFTAVAVGTGFFASMMGYSFGIVILFLAVKTPFSMAGEAKMVVDKWNSAGKTMWSKTGGAAGRAVGTEARLRYDRLQPVSKIREKMEDYKDTQKKRITYSKQGRNYEAEKKDKGKQADISNAEAELGRYEESIAGFPQVEQAIKEQLAHTKQKQQEAIDKKSQIATSILHATDKAELDMLEAEMKAVEGEILSHGNEENRLEGALAKIPGELSHLQAQAAAARTDIAKKKKGLSRGTKASLEAIQRSVLKGKMEEDSAATDQMLKSAAGQNAANTKEYKKLVARTRDVRQTAEAVETHTKLDSDRSYRAADDVSSDPKNAERVKMKEKRQFERAYLEAEKRIYQEDLDKEKVNAAVLHMMKITDNPGLNVGKTAQGVAGSQGKEMAGFVKGELAKNLSTVDLNKDYFREIFNKQQISGADGGEREKVMDYTAKILRHHRDITGKTTIDNQNYAVGLMEQLRTLTTNPEHLAELNEAIKAVGKAGDDVTYRKALAQYKSTYVGSRFGSMIPDPAMPIGDVFNTDPSHIETVQF